MQNNPFVILGISENSTQQEVQEAYERLHKKYSEERFMEGEKGAEAARMYTKVEIAYQDALDFIHNKATQSADDNKKEFNGNNYDKVIEAIKKGDISEAQKQLDNMTNRSAEWHFWQAAVYHRKNWYDESRTQLKIALELEPDNQKYKDALSKLEKEQNAKNPFNENKNAQNQNQYNRTYSNQQQGHPDVNGCCNCCSSLICADCCCEMCGGDLISCC